MSWYGNYLRVIAFERGLSVPADSHTDLSLPVPGKHLGEEAQPLDTTSLCCPAGSCRVGVEGERERAVGPSGPRSFLRLA